MLLFYNSYNKDMKNFGLGTTLVLHFQDLYISMSDTEIRNYLKISALC